MNTVHKHENLVLIDQTKYICLVFWCTNECLDSLKNKVIPLKEQQSFQPQNMHKQKLP